MDGNKKEHYFLLSPEQLSVYTGVYASTSIPLKITVTTDDNSLIAQGTGQPSIVLECFEMNKFRYEPAQIVMEFVPEQDKMILLQGGATITFSRE